MNPVARPVDKDEILRSVAAERRSTLRLVRGLTPEQFDAQTALAGWRVREVLAHLITTDRAAVTGQIIPQMLRTSTASLERWNETQVPAWAARSMPDQLMALDRWGRRFVRSMGLIPSKVYQVVLPSAWGKVPLGMMVWLRAYDEWVHRQDIRRALRMGDETVDLSSIAEFLLMAIGYDIARRGPRSPGGTVEVSLRATPIAAWRYDLAAARAAPMPTALSADADGQQPALCIIDASAPAFIMAAAGRNSFDELRSEGSLTVEGDASLADAFLGPIRIV